MKAIIKATGEFVEVIKAVESLHGNIRLVTDKNGLSFSQDEIEFITGKHIDWEQRTFDAAVAIMAAICNENDFIFQKGIEHYEYGLAQIAIQQAKALVAEYRKEGQDE